MIKKFLSFLPQIIASLFLAGFAAYAWTGPSSPPPNENAPAPINVGSSSQTFLDSKTLRVKSDGSGVINLEGGLGVGGLFRSFYTAVFDGKVGIGTTNPSQLLHLKSSAGDAAIRLQTNASSIYQTITFNYTGGTQNWTVPAWVTSIQLQVAGAQGHNGYPPPSNINSGGISGTGSIVSGTLSVTPGETLTIIIGGQNGFYGGGVGGGGGGGGAGGSGGGASSILRGATSLVVAGGGGGGGGGGAGSTYAAGGTGGSSGINGSDGMGGTPVFNLSCPTGNGGKGGTQSAGGVGGASFTGIGCNIPGGSGWNGSVLWGGAGGAGADFGAGGGGGGGAGGGYYGGGGGAGGSSAGGWGVGGGGGGGGSSLMPVGTGVSTGQTGNGQIIITYSSNPDTNWILGAGPATNGKFKISNSSVFGTTDALVLDDQGIILKAFNGSNCYRIRVDNGGTLSTISVTCP